MYSVKRETLVKNFNKNVYQNNVKHFLYNFENMTFKI